MIPLSETLDLISLMQPKENNRPYKASIPLRTVTGKLNPTWLEVNSDPMKHIVCFDKEAMEKAVTGFGRLVKSLIENEERIIDEFCGLIPEEPEDPRSWNPQYVDLDEQFPFAFFDGQWHPTKPTFPHGPRMPPFQDDK